MAAPTEFWIRHDRGSDVIRLQNVVEFARGHSYYYGETYRDEWTPENKAVKVAPGSGTTTEIFPLDVVPVENSAVEYNTGYANLRYKNPDSRNHTPWRFKRELLTGYFFGFVAGAIQDRLSKEFYAVDVTVSSTTNLCTTASAHSFNTGDLVVFATTTTFPTNITGLVRYEVLKVSSTTFYLMVEGASTIVDIGSAGAGTHTVSLVSPVLPPTNPDENVIFIPDRWSPRISTVAS